MRRSAGSSDNPPTSRTASCRGRCTPFDLTERAKVGRRQREWTAIGETEVECVRAMARCLREIREGRVPMPVSALPTGRIITPTPPGARSPGRPSVGARRRRGRVEMPCMATLDVADLGIGVSMNHHRTTNGRASLLLALAAALVVLIVQAGEAKSASWSAAIPVTGWGFKGEDLVALDGRHVIALVSQDAQTGSVGRHIYTKRSADSAATWGPRVAVARGARGWDIAGDGLSVDVAWSEDDSPSEQRLLYRRSTDGGRSYLPERVLAKVTAPWWERSLGAPRVARGPHGRVVVTWAESESSYSGGSERWRSTIYVRTSIDGGVTFRSRVRVATVRGSAWYELSLGHDVIYVAYTTRNDEIRLKRSFDDGQSWTTGNSIASGVEDGWGFELVADGESAYVAWLDYWSGRLDYRRTRDRGDSWSKVSTLIDPGNQWILIGPAFSIQQGVLRAVVWRDRAVGSAPEALYMETHDGRSWSDAETAFGPATITAVPTPATSYADRTVILITLWEGYFDDNGHYQTRDRVVAVRSG